ncbi:hypothetical protein D3C85_685030 [compost metagenome]
MEIDSEAPTPMFLRYSMWIGETERRVERERSSGRPSWLRAGMTGTGTAFTSVINLRRLRRYSSRAWAGMSVAG